MKMYKLLGADGEIYLSETPGTLGDNGNMKIYGRLDCGTVLRSMRIYLGECQKHHVFFSDEKTALAAGYRPCGNYLRKKYHEYIANPEKYKEKFGL